MQLKNLKKGDLVEIYISSFSGTKFGIVVEDTNIDEDISNVIKVLCYNNISYIPYYFISNLIIHN